MVESYSMGVWIGEEIFYDPNEGLVHYLTDMLVGESKQEAFLDGEEVPLHDGVVLESQL